MKGVVEKKTRKGYGFISVEGEEDDLFFHSNNLVDVDFSQISEGDEVTFEKESTDKGPSAVNVERV
ncbi:MAG: cold-shock protein [Candidatus Magasanikbacteria bacterium]